MMPVTRPILRGPLPPVPPTPCLLIKTNQNDFPRYIRDLTALFEEQGEPVVIEAESGGSGVWVSHLYEWDRDFIPRPRTVPHRFDITHGIDTLHAYQQYIILKEWTGAPIARFDRLFWYKQSEGGPGVQTGIRTHGQNPQSLEVDCDSGGCQPVCNRTFGSWAPFMTLGVDPVFPSNDPGPDPVIPVIGGGQQIPKKRLMGSREIFVDEETMWNPRTWPDGIPLFAAYNVDEPPAAPEVIYIGTSSAQNQGGKGPPTQLTVHQYDVTTNPSRMVLVEIQSFPKVMLPGQEITIGSSDHVHTLSNPLGEITQVHGGAQAPEDWVRGYPTETL